MQNLSSCQFNKYFVISSVNKACPHAVRRRFFDLGFTHGQKVKKVRSSLLGKVILVEIRGYLLSVRSSLAKFLEVEE